MIVLPSELQQMLGEHPFEALMNTEGEIYRKQPLRETALITLNDKRYFIKKHFGITLSECLKNWFSGRMPVMGAKPEWQAIQALNQMGILTTPLVGYGKQGLWPFTQHSFVLTQALEDCTSLETLCAAWPDSPPSLKEKRDLIRKVARITRTLHENGWVHRDLYLCHFLKDSNHALHLIDLHRMQQPRFFKKRWIVKDLAGLLFSSLDIGLTRNDVLCFVREYSRPLPMKMVIERANQMYFKAHHDLPLQTWMRTGDFRLPLKTGNFHERYTLEGEHFDAVSALRVLPKRRWVMKGHWKGGFAVLKLFVNERDYHHEMTVSKALHESGILAPKLLSQGKLGSYFALVYQYIDHAHPIETLNPALINTMVALHKAGLVQTDCHRDNFLQKDSRIYVLDPGGIKIMGEVDQAKAMENLALLFAQWPAVEDPEHLPQFSFYLLGRQWADSPLLQLQLVQAITQRRIRARKTWLSKIFRNCTPIKCKQRFFYRYCTRRDFDTLYTQTLFNYPEAYFHDKANFLKQGHSATVVRTHIGDHDLVIKRFNRKNWIKRFKRYLTPSKAARAWKMSHAMESIGIATPKPLAFIEKRFGPICLDSYYICEYTPGERLDRLDTLDDCSEAINQMMDALDSAMCAHGDLKASNMLWDGETLYLLDTDGAKFYKSRRKFQAAHEADWKRLLRNWNTPFPIGGKK